MRTEFFAAKSSVVAYGARMCLLKKLSKLIGRQRSTEFGVVTNDVVNAEGDEDEAGGSSILSAPISRKKKAGDCVGFACADIDVVESEVGRADRGLMDLETGDADVAACGARSQY
jgi:hypothetical protein